MRPFISGFICNKKMQLFKPNERNPVFRVEIFPINVLLCLPFPPVRYLLKNNVSPDLCNEDGLTALHQVRFTRCICSSLLFFVIISLLLSASPVATSACVFVCWTNYCEKTTTNNTFFLPFWWHVGQIHFFLFQDDTVSGYSVRLDITYCGLNGKSYLPFLVKL